MNELKNVKILYIDDEEFIRENAVEYLSFYCDNVYWANDGLHGLEIYEKIKPDIIITDIKMPKLNGLDMVVKIREKDVTTKIIIVTAFLETSYLLKAVELGLIKYLIKPILVDQLLPVLKKCILGFEKTNSIYKIDKHFSYDIFNQTLFYGTERISLTKKALLALDLLVSNSNRAVKYEEFSQYVWDDYMSGDALRAVIKELRKKISKKCISNVSSIGYKLDGTI